MPTHLRNLIVGLFAGLIVVVVSTATNAQTVSESDRAAFRQIITDQIGAFRQGDASAAFAFAAPGIRQKFSNAQTFIDMVRTAYLPVYDPQQFTFGPISDELGHPTQRVSVIGPDGTLWIALYGMQHQPDGSWKIGGVALVRPPGEST